ncbi:hypothetical protein [Flavisericum labens]|uniref:hypothetical protein n=1 Tax=Flavisericum labens TaxID=3377112 RepID=UPI00387AEA60
MTNSTKQVEKKGDRPTHGLFIKSEQFGNEIPFRLSGVWNYPEKGYMSLSPEKLQIRENPNAKNGEPRFQLFLKTKLYGKDASIKFGEIKPDEEKNCFEVNLGDLVIFENKPRDVEQPKKIATNGQPQP